MTDEHSSASEVAGKMIADAAEVATHVVAQAAEHASAVVQAQSDTIVADERMTKVLVNALQDVFGEKTASGRFIDVSRIPLICQNINGIHKSIEAIEKSMEKSDARHVSTDQFDPFKKIVYGIVGVTGVAIVGAILNSVLK